MWSKTKRVGHGWPMLAPRNIYLCLWCRLCMLCVHQTLELIQRPEIRGIATGLYYHNTYVIDSLYILIYIYIYNIDWIFVNFLTSHSVPWHTSKEYPLTNAMHSWNRRSCAMNWGGLCMTRCKGGSCSFHSQPGFDTLGWTFQWVLYRSTIYCNPPTQVE